MEKFEPRSSVSEDPIRLRKKTTLGIIDRLTEGAVKTLLERKKIEAKRNVSLEEMGITVDMIVEESFSDSDPLRGDPDIRKGIGLFLEKIEELGLDKARKTKLVSERRNRDDDIKKRMDDFDEQRRIGDAYGHEKRMGGDKDD